MWDVASLPPPQPTLSTQLAQKPSKQSRPLRMSASITVTPHPLTPAIRVHPCRGSGVKQQHWLAAAGGGTGHRRYTDLSGPLRIVLMNDGECLSSSVGVDTEWPVQQNKMQLRTQIRHKCHPVHIFSKGGKATGGPIMWPHSTVLSRLVRLSG